MSEPELTLLIGVAAWMVANAIAALRLRRR